MQVCDLALNKNKYTHGEVAGEDIQSLHLTFNNNKTGLLRAPNFILPLLACVFHFLRQRRERSNRIRTSSAVVHGVLAIVGVVCFSGLSY